MNFDLVRLLSITMALAAAFAAERGRLRTGTADTTARDHLDRFTAVAMCAEGRGDAPLQKWAIPIRLFVSGSYVAADLSEIDAIVTELRPMLAPLEMDWARADSEANLHVRFAPAAHLAEITGSPVHRTCKALCVSWTNDNRGIGSAVVAVDQNLQAPLRAHTLRKGITQALGLASSVWDDPASVFYAGEGPANAHFTASDRQIIRTLYRADLRPGMDLAAVRRVLASLP